jgi:hypothetical protein
LFAEFEDAQPDLDEPPFDHVRSRGRILVPVKSLHPFVLGEAKCFLLDLDAPGSSGLPGRRESHGQEQCWLPHPPELPAEGFVVADIRYAALRSVSAGPIHVGAVLDGHDRKGVQLIVDTVDHSVVTAPGTMKSGEPEPERLARPVGVLGQ